MKMWMRELKNLNIFARVGGNLKLDHGQLGFGGSEDFREMADSKKERPMDCRSWLSQRTD